VVRNQGDSVAVAAGVIRPVVSEIGQAPVRIPGEIRAANTAGAVTEKPRHAAAMIGARIDRSAPQGLNLTATT
jgi:hypothetical protein